MAGEGIKIFFQIDSVLTQVMSVKSAAYHLKYAQRTVRQWCDEGKLIAINVDGRWWIPLDEIERLKRRDESLIFQAS